MASFLLWLELEALVLLMRSVQMLLAFNLPLGLLAVKGTALYVADSRNNRVRHINILTAVVSTLAGNGAATSVDGTGAMSSIYYPFILPGV